MKRQEFEATLQALAQGWASKDYEKVASHFAEDVQYADPTRYRISSRAELLEFFRDDEGYDQSTVWHNVVFDEEKQTGAAEYTYQGTHRYHGLVIVKVHGNLITHWREYQHVSDLGWEDYCDGTLFTAG
ncbi:MAG TPA: nuclear transport factor 2 family protein [Thermoanaerobaculia bacterium]|nr:nuclear transport factor 2 family protein [Thermoanaerobaculia bacterium]